MSTIKAFTGAGIGYRQVYRDQLLSADTPTLPSVLEIVPTHFFANPDRLVALAERFPLVFHEVACSVGTATPVDREAIARIKDLLSFCKPLFFTEHLALTTSPDGIDLGHLAPLWLTHTTLDLVAERIKRWQDELGLEVALETITAPFVIPGADMTETEFFHALVDKTGCGLLLDLTNQVINAHNLGFEVLEHLEGYPLEAVVQIHLAGGKLSGDVWVDSHSAPVDDSSFELLRVIRDRAPLRTIIVERDEHLPPIGDLVAEAARAEAIWRGDI